MKQQRVGWPEPTTLARLVREAKRDDREAVDALLRAVRPSLISFFSSRLAPDLADDLTQCALLRIAGAVHRIDPERADSYLSTVARNLLRTAYRRRVAERRRRVEVELADVPTGETPIDVQAEYEDLLRAVHRVAVEELPGPLSEIILSLLHGETTTEIAARQAVSPVTIRTRLMRARAVLRRELNGHIARPLPKAATGDAEPSSLP